MYHRMQTNINFQTPINSKLINDTNQGNMSQYLLTMGIVLYCLICDRPRILCTVCKHSMAYRDIKNTVMKNIK